MPFGEESNTFIVELNTVKALNETFTARHMLGCVNDICSMKPDDFAKEIDAMMQTPEGENIIFAGVWCFKNFVPGQPEASKLILISEEFEKFHSSSRISNYIDAAVYDSVNKVYIIIKVKY